MEAKDTNEMESRIIEAAKQVFVRKGYEAATMGDVAAEVGIGRTALHYYYRTKEILFDAIFDQLMSSLLPNISRILDEKSTMLQKMPAIIDQYMAIIRSNPMFPIFVVKELNRDPQRLFRTVLRDPRKIQPMLRLRKQMEQEMEEGLIRRMPVIDLVSTIVSLVVFPMLIREPLLAAFLDGDMNEFEKYMDRRKELIVGVVTRMMAPEA
ncbi:TetR/AcrR family transcriptional regulator [Parabacteroides sp.]